jgi:hypothetical protein
VVSRRTASTTVVRRLSCGWAAGAPEDDDVLNDRLARACGIVVVSPEYRLVPEVTVVEQIADCVTVADWPGGHAEAEFGSATLLIGGISAGVTWQPRRWWYAARCSPVPCSTAARTTSA